MEVGGHLTFIINVIYKKLNNILLRFSAVHRYVVGELHCRIRFSVSIRIVFWGIHLESFSFCDAQKLVKSDSFVEGNVSLVDYNK